MGVGGVLLVAFEYWQKEPADAGEELSVLPYRMALLLGVAQSVAMVPGVSRSAATIVGGLWLGMSRRAIVEFSFLLALPTMAAASGLDLLKHAGSFDGSQWQLLSVGFLVSWGVAWAAIAWLLRFIRTHDFTAFGIYRVLAAFAFWLVLR
jgi:undecaprenyl-diphosphatase